MLNIHSTQRGEQEVLELEGLNEKDRHTISPFEHHQALIRIEKDEKEIARLKGILHQFAVLANGFALEEIDRQANEG